MRNWICCVIVAAACLLSLPAQSVELVRENQPMATVVLPDEALPVETLAAEDLAHHAALATGAELAIVAEAEAPAEGNRVFIGATQAAAAAGLSAAGLDVNGYLIRAEADRMFILGDDTDGDPGWILHNNRTRVGTLFGVYYLLDRELGARWLWPGPLGEVVPERTSIAFEDLDLTGQPAFVHARWRDGGRTAAGTDGWREPANRSNFISAQSRWLRRHRFALGVNMDMAHAFTTWWEKHGEEHPEYFNLLPDGTRRSDPTYHGGAPRLISMDVSEPAFHEAIVENWLATRTEDDPFIDASENDTAGKCTCQRCMSWDVPDPRLEIPWDERLEQARAAFEAGERDWVQHLGSVSDRYARFFLAVQAEARKHDPEAVVTGYAYSNYRFPPLETMLNDHIYIGIVPGGWLLGDADVREDMREQWDGWAATGARMMLRPNYMLDGHNMPLYAADMVGEHVRHCAENGMIATDFDSLTGQYATQGPNLYMLARLTARPDLTVDEVLGEFYSAFGPAEDAVRAYFAHWDSICDAVEERPEGMHWSYFYREADRVFTPATFARGEDLLERAEEAAAGDETALARVQWLQKGLQNARLTLETQQAYERYRAQGAIGQYREAITELDEFRASIEDEFVCNMAFLGWAEQRTWDRDLMKLMAQPGKMLEGPWKFAFDPEEVGEERRWFAQQFDDSGWVRTEVSAPWEELAVGKQWRAEHGQDYDGLAWYRTEFAVPEDAGRVRLIFGAVDEACTVWVNGEKVLERPYPFEGDTESWKKAFEVDVSDLARQAGPNVLAVRVEDNSGAGGIWRPVWLATSENEAETEANLIPDGGFEDGRGQWKMHRQIGEMSFEIVTDNPRTGGACAMIRCTAPGPEEDEERFRTRIWGRWHRAVGPVDPGKTYRLRLWVRTSDDFAGRIAIWVTGAGEQTMAEYGLNTEGLWREIAIEDIHPTGDQLHVFLNLMHGVGTAWFDDVELVAVD
ncbi:MAG: DUF4838 domain-containing protein [Armatimonadota bacterium]